MYLGFTQGDHLELGCTHRMVGWRAGLFVAAKVHNHSPVLGLPRPINQSQTDP